MTPQQRDAAYIDAHLQTLTDRAHELNKVAVLVRDREVIGYYDSALEATRDGYRKFGDEPFFVRQIVGPGALARP